jgi:hypothetical protein
MQARRKVKVSNSGSAMPVIAIKYKDPTEKHTRHKAARSQDNGKKLTLM